MTEHLTTSAALYFARKSLSAVPTAWFDWARAFFVEHNLTPILGAANGGEFLIDEPFVLAEHGEDVVLWEETLPARRTELIEALHKGQIEYLGLDSPRPGAVDREDWRADATLDPYYGSCFVGIDYECVSDPASLLLRVFKAASELVDIRYATAQTLSLAHAPDRLAVGSARIYSAAETIEFIRNHMPEPAKTADDLWHDELMKDQRHLTGLFRGAYPANILSAAHVRAAGLHSSGLGTLSELSGSRFLWQLSADELPRAQALLESRRLLVSQQTPSKSN